MMRLYKSTELTILLTFILIAPLAPISGATSTFSIVPDTSAYVRGETVSVTGKAGPAEFVSIDVFNDDSNLVWTSQVIADLNGDFQLSLFRFSPNDGRDFGEYTVEATAAGQKTTSKFIYALFTLDTTLLIHEPGDVLEVSGKVAEDILLTIGLRNPTGQIITSQEVTGTFSTRLHQFLESSSLTPFGIYSVEAQSDEEISIRSIEFRPLYSFSIADFILSDLIGNSISNSNVSTFHMVLTNITNVDIIPHPYAVVLSVRDGSELITQLSFTEGVIESGAREERGFSWTPNSAGNFSLEVSVMDTFNGSLMLSRPKLTYVTVTE